MDVARTEKVEAELTTFVERRHAKRRAEEGERRAEEAWAESARGLCHGRSAPAAPPHKKQEAS